MEVIARAELEDQLVVDPVTVPDEAVDAEEHRHEAQEEKPGPDLHEPLALGQIPGQSSVESPENSVKKHRERQTKQPAVQELRPVVRLLLLDGPELGHCDFPVAPLEIPRKHRLYLRHQVVQHA